MRLLKILIGFGLRRPEWPCSLFRVLDGWRLRRVSRCSPPSFRGRAGRSTIWSSPGSALAIDW